MARHLTIGASVLWKSILPVALCFGIPAIAFGVSDKTFRYEGLFLQIAGLLVVGYALGETLSSFRKASVTSRVASWFVTLIAYVKPRKQGQPTIVRLQGVTGLGPAGSMSGTPSLASISIEEKLARLTQDMARLRERVEQVDRDVTQAIEEVRRTLDQEVQGLKQADEELRKVVESEAVGDWDREIIGLVWLAFGTIFAGIPDELGELVHSMF